MSIPGAVGAHPGAVQTRPVMSFVASATANNTISMTIPGSPKAGDFVLFGAAAYDYPNEFSNPAGWDVILSETQTGGYGEAHLFRLYGKRLSADGGSAAIMDTGFATSTALAAAVFRGNFSSYAYQDLASILVDTDPAAQVISAAGSVKPLIEFGVVGLKSTNSDPAFSVESPAFDSTIVARATLAQKMAIRLGWSINNLSPVNRNIDKADQGAGNFLGSGYVEFS